MAAVPSTCLNCSAPLTGDYCARCGQKAVRPDLTVKGFLHETTHELTHWDGKIPATLRTLFFQPGVLTVDFLQGRRARWLLPLRVYLLCSVAFFGGRILLEEMGLRTTSDVAGVTLSRDDGTPGPLTAEERERIDRAPLAGIVGVERLERVAGDSARLNREINTMFPRAMFVLVPVFALLTSLVWRRRFNYPAHLYLALHLHAAFFGVMLLFSAAIAVAPSDAIATALFLVPLIYLSWYGLTAFRKVFQESWVMTAIKTVVVGVVYWTCLMTVTLALAAYAILKM
jgi:hypothetical protein